MPFIPPNLIQLFDTQSEIPLQVIAVNHKMQLCFIMHQSLHDSLNAYLQSGGKRVMQWIKQNKHRVINYLGDAKDFRNLNTPEDFLAHP